MTLTVCTGWSPEGWGQYGRRFLESFERYWPADVGLIVYGEDECSPQLYDYAVTQRRITSGRRFSFVPLSHIPGCAEFLERHRDNLAARGRLKLPQHHWKERAVKAGYNWRFDAWKFCRQGFIPEDAAQRAGTDFLCWLDGDVVTQRPLASANVITGLMPKSKAIAYLGREPKHPDIAFQLYDLRFHHMGGVDPWRMLAQFAEFYRSDEVFKLGEWHSAYVWQVTVGRAMFPTAVHNLTPGGSGHVWQQSPLRAWGDHLKGDRKFRALP